MALQGAALHKTLGQEDTEKAQREKLRLQAVSEGSPNRRVFCFSFC